MILFFASLMLALFIVGILAIPRITIDIPAIEPVEPEKPVSVGMPRDSRGRFTRR